MIRVRVLKAGRELHCVDIELDSAARAAMESAPKGDGLDELFGHVPPPSKSLLDHLEDKGLRMVFGCRSGTCATCRVKVIVGGALLEPPAPICQDTLTTFGFGSDIRLTCRAVFKSDAKGELVIEIPDE